MPLNLKHLLIAEIATAILGAAAANRLAEKDDDAALENSYGRKLSINGAQMCYLKLGTGEKTFVFIPGLGEPSPVMSFQPLAEKLAEKHTVIILEPFGYGLSDTIYTDRIIENIAEEYHKAITLLKAEGCILVGHSLAGIYALYLLNRYPSDARAFIGLDTTVPQIADYRMLKDLPVVSSYLNYVLSKTGTLRLTTLFNENLFLPKIKDHPFSDSEKLLMNRLILRSVNSLNILEETRRLGENIAKVKDLKYPHDIPCYFFTSSDNDKLFRKLAGKDNYWTDCHRQLTDNPLSVAEQLTSGHYVHHQHPDHIIEAINSWLVTLPQ